MKQIFKTIKIASILFLTLGLVSCEEDEVAFPKAFAEFTYTVNHETGVVKFINTSRNATIFNWSFGDQQTSTEVNPFHIYQPGSYTVSLVAKNIAGSFRTFQDIVTIGLPSTPGGGGSDECTPDAAQSLAAADLNLTFKDDPTASFIQDNATLEYVDNPGVSDLNNSCKVGKVTNANQNPWDNIQIDFAEKLTLTDESTFTMKVYSPESGYKVTLKLEDKATAGSVAKEFPSTTATTKTDEWEELTFEVSAADSGIYDKMVLFFDLENLNGNTYYFDDLKLNLDGGTGGGGGGGACEPETTQSLTAADINLTFKDDPSASIIEDNATFEYVDNPGNSSVNNSCKVGKVTNANQNPWDNIQIDFADKLTLTDGSTFTMKVYSPQSGYKVTLKLEDKASAGAIAKEFPSTTATTKTDEWEELTFNLSAADSGIYDKIVFFFDLENLNGNTYYFDDLKLNLDGGTGGGGGGSGGSGGGTGGGCSGDAVNATAFPVNFESCESFISTFNDAGSLTTSLDDNPAKTGINTSDYVLKVVKAAGTNRWAGFQNPFPSNFDATKTFKFKIYSTVANVVMRFEINSEPQDSGSGNPGPQFATIAAANTWTEVEIVFTGIPSNNTGVNQLVIKPDNPDGTDGELTSAEGIYYFDDIRLE